MYSCSNDITITPIISFVQQLSSVILLILLHILLKTEKFLVGKNQINLFFFYYCILFQNINCEKFIKTALYNSLGWSESHMLWCIVRLAQTTCFGKRAAVFEKSWDASNDLKSTDIKMKLIFSKPTNSSLSKYFFLCQKTQIIPPYPTALLLEKLKVERRWTG